MDWTLLTLCHLEQNKKNNNNKPRAHNPHWEIAAAYGTCVGVLKDLEKLRRATWTSAKKN